jgi:hypothetical protein
VTDQNQRSEMIGLAVYPDIKEEWKQAVEDDPDADSLSQLIRVAVSRHIYDRSKSGSEVSQEIHDELTELLSQQQTLDQRLNEMSGQLREIRDAVVGSEADPVIEELANDIFELLPSEQEIQTSAVLSGDYDTKGVPAPEPGTVEWLSNRLDASRYRIQSALNHLEQTTYSVKQTDDGRYYKEV